MRGIGIGGLVRRIIDHIASCGGRPLVVGGGDGFFIKKGDVDRAVRHRIGSAVEGDGGDVAREKLVSDGERITVNDFGHGLDRIFAATLGSSHNILNRNNAGNLDGITAGGRRKRGQGSCLRGCTGITGKVRNSPSAGSDSCAFCGNLIVGDSRRSCERERFLNASINIASSNAQTGDSDGRLAAFLTVRRPCRHDDEAQDQCQSQ